MRKLLLAATAMMSATLGTVAIANAQSAAPTVVVTPPPNPIAAMPGDVPQPGNVVVRLNARITAEFMVGNDSGSNFRLPNGVAAKAQGYYFGEFARLYPAFDGETPNGVKYGAALEVRQNSGGTGVNNSSANNPGVTGNTLYFRREMGYVGTDKLGTLRFGATDGVASLFLVGTFENFDYEGGWNGYLPGLFSPGTVLPWAFADVSGWYATSKLIYLSPNFDGFDFGLDWEPSSNQTSGDLACGGISTTVITSGCGTVSSISGPFSLINPDLMRRRNTTTIMGRYRGVFGPVGLVATGGWVHSGIVSDGNPGVAPVSYNGMNFFDGGAVLTYGGLAVGGHLTTGVANNLSVLPKGGKHETVFSLGWSYAVGPFLVGTSFINESFQGAWNGNAQTGQGNTLGLEHDIGISAGASYDWAPGATLYVDYLWGTRHQANHDFFLNTTGRNNNNTRAAGLVIGQNFRW